MGSITLNHITKIEGHASLNVKIERGKVKKCELGSIEGARFFEGLVEGKKYDDAREITSKICGICSCAHTIACLKALENALGVKTSVQTELLRELIGIGERIRSHATHLYMLVLPDFLGYESALVMAKKYRSELMTAMELIKLGNNIVSVVGGKEMHPFTSVVGGFTCVPEKEALQDLLKRLKKSKLACKKTFELFASLKYPKFERETEYFAIMPDKGLPLHYGKLVSTAGVNTSVYDYKKFLSEYIVRHSHAKFVVKDKKGYAVGPLARLNNAHELLDEECKALLKKHKIIFPSKNPFHNTLAQALELTHWVNRAIKIISENNFVFEGLPDIKPKAGHGVSAVEAPRGILFHEYELDKNGIIIKGNIIAPTTQLLRNMQDDIKEYLPKLLKYKKDKIVLEIEKLIRAWDPCFSCATHFLKVDWE